MGKVTKIHESAVLKFTFKNSLLVKGLFFFMGKIRKLPATCPFSSNEAVQEFLLLKQAEGKAERTIKDYAYYLDQFFAMYPEAWPDYHKLKQAVRKYFSKYADKSPTTYNIRRAYLKAFFSWCVNEGYLAANPVAGIPKRKDEGKPRSLDEEAIKALLEAIDTSTYTGLRDYALVLLQLDTGIRPNEALQLIPEHFNLQRLEVFIPATIAKTRQGRTVVFSPQTGKAIRKLLAVRPEGWEDTVPVFASQDGQKMLVTSWTNRLKKYAKKAGIKVSAYQLRHTSAIMQLRNGATAFHVQRQLGHADLTMTKRYIHLMDEDLHREHSICSPVANLLPERKRAKRKIKK